MESKNTFTNTQREQALKTLETLIHRCERMQTKFREGTSQHTLLKNRIKALTLSRSLISEGNQEINFSNEELIDALKPVNSIINKSEKAQTKFMDGHSFHTRFENLIEVMELSRSLIEAKIQKNTHRDQSQ